MKKLDLAITILASVILLALFTSSGLSQPVEGLDGVSGGLTVLPAQLMNTNVKDWQLNGVTVLLLVQVLGRAYAGLSKGGGLVGLFHGIVFGTNTPKPKE